MIVSPTSALWSIFALAFAAWAIVAATLVYHWHSYAAGDPKARRASAAFFVGSLILIASAASFVVSL